MRAARIDEFGGPEVLQVLDVDEPVPGPGQALLEVAGSSVNPADVAVREGWMQAYVPMSLPATLGIDVAGRVLSADAGTGLGVGDEVYGWAWALFGGSGGFAERAVVNAVHVAPRPASLSALDAATLPHAAVGAVQVLTEVLSLRPGDRLLVTGAGGAVGGFTVMVARSMGVHVVASARASRAADLVALGADEVVDAGDPDWRSLLDPVDASLELVRGDDPGVSLGSLRDGGQQATLVWPPDAGAEARGITATMVSVGVTTERLRRVTDLVESGVLTPRVHARYALQDIHAAFEALAGGGVVGKIGVTVG